jgi:hypothetical protein
MANILLRDGYLPTKISSITRNFVTFYGLDPQIRPECYNDDGKGEDVPVNDIKT